MVLAPNPSLICPAGEAALTSPLVNAGSVRLIEPTGLQLPSPRPISPGPSSSAHPAPRGSFPRPSRSPTSALTPEYVA